MSLTLYLRIAFVALAFAGLCASFRVLFRVDALIAPAAAAGFAISALMLAGMLGALRVALYCLYAAGLAGGIYAYLAKKSAPPRSPILLLAALLAFLCLYFHSRRVSYIDDVNHWALVARHLIRYNRFPKNQDSFILFRSYPLGMACFIYFFLQPIGEIESAYFIVQNLLPGMLLLPVFSLIKPRRAALYPLAISLFLLIFSAACAGCNLCVDAHLPLWGIATAATIARYRDDFKRALYLALPMMIATVFTKNSGMFFALCASGMLICVARRNRLSSKRLNWILIALPLVCYGLWAVSTKLRYPGMLHTKHAISPVDYLKKMHQKGLAGVLQIGGAMLVAFFRPDPEKLVYLAFAALCILLLFTSCRSFPPEGRRRYRSAALAALGVYLSWYALLFLMYIFSMPQDEALRLASYARYDQTGYSYVVGLLMIFAFCASGKEAPASGGRTRALTVTSALVAAATLLLAIVPSDFTSLPKLLAPAERPESDALLDKYDYLRAHNDIPNQGTYLLFTQNGRDPHYNLRLFLYEFESEKTYHICASVEEPGAYQAGYQDALQPVNDIQSVLRENMDAADALIILDESPAFEAELRAFLRTYAGSTPVYRAYAQ